MIQKPTAPWGAGPENLGDPRQSPEWQTLVKALAVQQRKQAAWLELSDMALERLREALKDPGAIDCPAILEACDRLAAADPGKIQMPFNAFQQAMLDRSRTPTSPAEMAAIQHLANRACDLYQAVAEATEKALEASNAAALIRAQAARLGTEKQPGGGLH